MAREQLKTLARRFHVALAKRRQLVSCLRSSAPGRVYSTQYSNFHAGLLAFVGRHFARVESGLQGDSWIWILDGEEKVSIDTFTSMKHQIKSPRAGAHVQKVIDALLREFQLRVYADPVLEAHEDV